MKSWRRGGEGTKACSLDERRKRQVWTEACVGRRIGEENRAGPDPGSGHQGGERGFYSKHS